MTARNIKTGIIYEGGKKYISSIIGVDPKTLWIWEKKFISEIYNNYEVRFNDIVREPKQLKGFRINKQNIYSNNKK